MSAELPKGWKHFRLKDVASRITDGTHQTPEFSDAGVPFLVISNVVGGKINWDSLGKWVSRSTYEALTARIKPEFGDVLYTAVGSYGVAIPVVTDREFVFQRHIAHIRPIADRVDFKYLTHFLNSPECRRYADSVARGVAQKTVTLGDLAELPLVLPPLDKQRRIAAILDKAVVIRRKCQQALDLADDFLRSAFLEMFGATAYPEMPLADVVAKGTIVTYGIVQAGPEVEDGVPYIRTGDIKNGEIDPAGLRHTSPDIAAKFARSRVNAGDIVMSIRATVGTTAIVPPELDGANLTQGTARISPGNSTTPEYLLCYLRSNAAQNWIEQQVKGATFREITLARLRELLVPIPPLAVQERFTVAFKQVQRLIDACRDDGANASNLFASLSQRAFRGEL